MRRALKFLFVLLAVLLLASASALIAFRVAAALRETAVASELAPASGKFVQTRLGRLFIQEAGPVDGVPVVLFHGTAAWSELWRGTMTALADAGFRAIAIDIPPFGFSDRSGGYTRAEQAVRVADLFEALGIRSAIIIGHSFGAGAAVETVMRSPARVRGLVLVDAALGLTAQSRRAAPTEPPFPLRHEWMRNTLVAATFTNPLLTRFLLEQLIAQKHRAPSYVEILQRPMTLKNTTSDFGKWLLYFVSDDREAMSAARANYQAIALQTAILWGDKDTITPLDQAEDLRTLLHGATLTVLPGLGHIPQIEDPDAFNRALLGELQKMR